MITLKDNLNIGRPKLEFLYSIFLLVIIPLLIAANTILLINGVRKNFDSTLRGDAYSLTESLSLSFKNQLDEPKKIQATIDDIALAQEQNTSNNELRYNSLLVISGSSSSSAKIIAALDKTQVGKSGDNTQTSLVYENKRPIIYDQVSSQERLSNILYPIEKNGKTIGAIRADISYAEADASVSELIMRSFVIMGVSIVVIVILLLNHFRFVEYAMLFKKLQEVDELKSDFLNVATHELKAPMTVIKGNIENINDGLLGHVEPKIKESLDAMYAETERLNNLVTDLLNVSRIEQGKINYQLENVEISEIITKITQQYSPIAQQKGFHVIYDSSNAQAILADKGRVIEIITNLVDNAVKYSINGDVSISHKLNGSMLSTTVRDSGIGMSSKDREKLFNRFYRIRNENTKNISGTGLGLWIIKQYIEAMSGSITVDSLEGVGSEFKVDLPIATKSKNTADNDK